MLRSSRACSAASARGAGDPLFAESWHAKGLAIANGLAATGLFSPADWRPVWAPHCVTQNQPVLRTTKVNVPMALSNVLIVPGDIVIADDDGAVVVPAAMVPLVLEHTPDYEEWEEFSRNRLSEGGSIRR